MNRIKQRKAFTIVELIIVISVIGVLAAILIPTFSNVVYKANYSRDISAAKNMNTALSTATDVDLRSVSDVMYIMAMNGCLHYLPRVDGNRFVWDSKENVILYVDADNIVQNKVHGYSTPDDWLSLEHGGPNDSDSPTISYGELFN